MDYDEDDKVVLCADEAVREAITTVFDRFDELGSARQVLIRLREDAVLLSRRHVTVAQRLNSWSVTSPEWRRRSGSVRGTAGNRGRLRSGADYPFPTGVAAIAMGSRRTGTRAGLCRW